MPPPPCKRLTVALIHNHQSDRNGRLVPALEQLCASFDASLVMVSWQPSLRSHTLATRLRRDWRHYRLQLAWSRYRKFGLRHAIGITRAFATKTLVGHLDTAHRARMCRISQIETLVTAKHIVAWQAFLESDATHLLCCEDDLVIKADSIDRLRNLLTGPDLDSGLRYIDLAGGLPVTMLDIDRLVANRSGDKTFYVRGVTNTACSYLLSRELAEQFMTQLIRNPELRLVGIDWMMNAMLMTLHAKQTTCDALHFDPPIFGHGTFTGDYVSWMQIALASGKTPSGTITQ
jgi:hypothetical protein